MQYLSFRVGDINDWFLFMEIVWGFIYRLIEQCIHISFYNTFIENFEMY